MVPDASRTLISWYLERVAVHGDRPALLTPAVGGCRWRTWAELDKDVRRAALALVDLGVESGQHVALWSENRYEWLVCDLAVQLVGGVLVPLHAALAGPQACQQIRHSRARLLLVGSTRQAENLAQASEDLSPDLTCYSFDTCGVVLGGRKIGLWPAQLPESFDRRQADRTLHPRIAGVTPDSLATILYTSGTLGEPKGVMLTQGNLAFNAWAAGEATGESAADLKLAFLPLSHSYARTCDLYKWIVCGGQLALAQSRDTVFADCAAVRPTWLNGVPYFFDKARRELIHRGLDGSRDGLRGLLGGRIQTCHCGGAPVSQELSDFYWSHNVPFYTGYGLTEASPVIADCSPRHQRVGSVGHPISGIEVAIAPDGEILTRGPHVMRGYWQDPDATHAAIRDGWLHTGDLGHIDSDGFLFITGRKREIIVTTGGKKVSPAFLESVLTEDPWIAQAVVVGEGRDYLAALIVPSPESLAADTERGERTMSDSELAAQFAARIRQRLKGVSHYEQVRSFLLLSRPFLVELGEMTPKQSLRRAVIQQHFAAEIDALYAPGNLDRVGGTVRITPAS
jgi:long-chain acyl-CoA synthetase